MFRTTIICRYKHFAQSTIAICQFHQGNGADDLIIRNSNPKVAPTLAIIPSDIMQIRLFFPGRGQAKLVVLDRQDQIANTVCVTILKWPVAQPHFE